MLPVHPLPQGAREGRARGLRAGLASPTGARPCAELHRCRRLCPALPKASNPLVGRVQVGLAAKGAFPGLLDQIPLLRGEDGSKRVGAAAEVTPGDGAVVANDVDDPGVALVSRAKPVPGSQDGLRVFG